MFVLLCVVNRVALRTVRFPAECRIAFHGFGDDNDLLCHHEGGIEAYAELTDDINVAAQLMLLLEGKRAALGDGTEVFLQFLTGHAAALVAYSKCAGLLVRGDLNGKVVAAQTDVASLHGIVIELVGRVAGV